MTRRRNDRLVVSAGSDTDASPPKSLRWIATRRESSPQSGSGAFAGPGRGRSCRFPYVMVGFRTPTGLIRTRFGPKLVRFTQSGVIPPPPRHDADGTIIAL